LFLTLCLFVEGHPKQFAADAGLVESGLAGSCSDIPLNPGNDGHPEDAFDPEVGAAFADKDEDKKPAAIPTPEKEEPPKSKSKTTEECIESLAKDVRKWTIKSEMGLDMKTFHVRDVPVRGQVADTNDVLAVQFAVTPGAVLDTVEVNPNQEDANEVAVVMDLDANVSDADKRIKERWERTAPCLASQMRRDLQRSCDGKKVAGQRFERSSDTFNWPNGLRSTNKPVDPWTLGLRKRPTRGGASLCEIDNLSLTHGRDDVAPLWLVTAFFFTQDCTGTVKSGGLKMNQSSDEEEFSPKSGGGGKKRAKKARVVEDDEDCDEVMFDDSNNGNGGGGSGGGIGKGKAGPLGSVLAAMTMGMLFR